MVNPSFIKISDLNLSKTLKHVLCKRLDLVTLQDLLNIDYSILINTRGIGRKKIEELTNCVESFGFTLLDYQKPLQDIKQEKKMQGAKLLEEWGFNLTLCSSLYKNNLFTLEDLIACGRNVYNLKGIGSKNGMAIWKKMQELDISFPKPLDVDEELFGSLEQLHKENDKIRQDLKEKRTVLKKYKYANQVKENLLREQAILNAQLKEQRQPLYSILIDGKGGVTYLYDNTVSDGLDASSMMGFLIHCNSTKELVNQIPISKYYVLDEKHQILEITRQQANFLYDQILEYVLKKQDWRK